MQHPFGRLADRDEADRSPPNEVPYQGILERGLNQS